MRIPEPLVLVAPVLLVLSTVTAAQTQDDERPSLVLIQSELDHLEARDVPVTLRFTETEPEKVFQAIASATGVDIELKGRFPDAARMTIDLPKTSLKEALTRLARDHPVYYHVPRPDKLVVVVEPEKPNADQT